MRKRLSSILVAATLVLLFVPSGVQRAQGKTVGPPEVAWKDMTLKQKKAYMKAAVEPTMKPIFREFDAKEFKKFDCVTCHGKDGVNASSRCRAMTSTRCRTRRKPSRPS